MLKARGYAVQSATTPLSPFQFERRDPRDHDVVIEIAYCGVCHSDIHAARSEWGPSIYPLVPGHEIVGHVIATGSKVKKFKTGDRAGIGCLVDSCRTCSSCHEGLQQYCENGFSLTYNGYEQDKKTPTYGGYSNLIVVDESFALTVSPTVDLAKTAPLLCAGITTYSPLKRAQIQSGQRVAIIGLGGLGHMAIKFARSFGADVTLLTTSPNKQEDALRLGAHQVMISSDAKTMNNYANSFDFMLDTVSAKHDINPYLNLLKRNGTLVFLGIPPEPISLDIFKLVIPPRKIMGSLIGGLPETQEMLDYCAKHNIVSDIELIAIDQVETAYQRMIHNDVKYRFVIDLKTLK